MATDLFELAPEPMPAAVIKTAQPRPFGGPPPELFGDPMLRPGQAQGQTPRMAPFTGGDPRQLGQAQALRAMGGGPYGSTPGRIDAGGGYLSGVNPGGAIPVWPASRGGF